MSRVSTAYLLTCAAIGVAGGVLLVGGYPLLAAQSFDLWSMTAPALVAFLLLCLASCLAGTWIGILVADRLQRAGVARLTRRREVPAAG